MKHILKYQLVTAEPNFTVKTINCMQQTVDLGREHSILQHVNFTTDVYQVSYYNGRCVKMGACSESQWTLVLGYLTI